MSTCPKEQSAPCTLQEDPSDNGELSKALPHALKSNSPSRTCRANKTGAEPSLPKMAGAEPPPPPPNRCSKFAKMHLPGDLFFNAAWQEAEQSHENTVSKLNSARNKWRPAVASICIANSADPTPLKCVEMERVAPNKHEKTFSSPKKRFNELNTRSGHEKLNAKSDAIRLFTWIG